MDVIKRICEECAGAEIRAFDLIREKAGVHVYRCLHEGRRAVVKYFEREGDRREIQNYRILKILKVPVMKVFALHKSCIVMEDIEASDEWRLGVEGDMKDPDVLRGLARWYFALHDAGWRFPSFHGMYSENDDLKPSAVEMIRQRVSGAEELCDYVSKHLDELRTLIFERENTITYNDFYYTNFLVRKDGSAAMMFDFNCMGRGYRYADFRNVESSVSGEAFAAFMEEYGALHRAKYGTEFEIDETDRRIDGFLSPFLSLANALRREKFPQWAESAREEAINGTLLERAGAIMEERRRKILRMHLEDYAPYNEQEEKDREIILRWLETGGEEIFTRKNRSAHVTASAWVVSPDRRHVLMAYHNLYKSWAWLGGHADGQADLMAAARREVMEESGVRKLRPLAGTIFSVEVLTVDGHEKKGEYVTSHLHLNMTYLFEADMDVRLSVKPDENSAVGWIPVGELAERVSETWFIDRVYGKLQEKAERLGRMKKVILSADSAPAIYAVPDQVAKNLKEYCLEFCQNWLYSSPDAQKYHVGRGVCYTERDFIEYLNKYVFPGERSFAVWRGECLPEEYRDCPAFNF